MDSKASDIISSIAPLLPSQRIDAAKEMCGEDAQLLKTVLDSLDRLPNNDSPTEDVSTNTSDSHREAPPEIQEAGKTGPRDRKVGHFKIEGSIPLGRGGFGEVWSAMRDEGGFRQRVAIKILSRAISEERVVKRFELERQVLASLDHPDIARLIDGGTLDDGRPWLAMEFVDGVTITEYCDRERLTVEARIRLFQRVAMAVQHAHENLVIHRDIKPDNVLVTNDGGPKLLDFGIAKIVNPELGGLDSAMTQAGEGVLTPDYAAPEQFTGEGIGVRSDVYSLGVLLYELLTGRKPFDNKEKKYREIRTAKLELEPPAPSLAISTISTDPASHRKICENRDTVAGRLRKRLLGDIDVILLKSLRREPSRRYSSPREFVQDLQRHLEGLPVEARPDSVAYRTTRFVARHRTSVALASTVTLALMLTAITFAALSAQSAEAARAEAAESRAEMESIRAEAEVQVRMAFEEIELEANTIANNDLVDALQLANRLDAAKSVLESMLTRLNLALEITPNNVNIKELRIRALHKLAAVHMSDLSPSLGEKEIADQYRTKARNALQNARQEHPDNGALLAFETVLALDQMDSVPPEERRELMTAATQQLIEAVEMGTHEIRDEMLMARIGNELGDIERSEGQLDNAMGHYQQSREAYTKLMIKNTDDARVKRRLAITDAKIGSLLLQMNELEESRAFFERSLELREELAANEERTDALRARRDLATGHKLVADVLYQMKSYELSKFHLKQYLDLTFQVAWLDPLNKQGAIDDVIQALTLAQRLPRLSDGEYAEMIQYTQNFRNRIIQPRLDTFGDIGARRLALLADRNLSGLDLNTAVQADADGDTARSTQSASNASNRLRTVIEIAAPILKEQRRDAALIAEIGLCNLYKSVSDRLLGDTQSANVAEVEADRLFRLAMEIDADDSMVRKLGRQIDAFSELVRDGS